MHLCERGRAAAAGQSLVGVESPPTPGHTDIPKDVGRELRLWHRNETAPRKSDDAARLKVALGLRMKRRNPVGASQNRAVKLDVQPSPGMALS